MFYTEGITYNIDHCYKETKSKKSSVFNVKYALLIYLTI